jgi:formamidopyrimidine-DNA glycosylase
LKIINSSVIDIKRISKYIIISLSNGENLIIHLGMSGTFTYNKKNTEIKKHSHVDLIFDNFILRYNDPRRFGVFIVQKNIEENKFIKNCGIEPFVDNLHDIIFDKTRNKKTPIKTFLMKNSIICGIGNIYANESLFRTNIDPRRESGLITYKECIFLSKNIKKILYDSIENGGTTLKDHRTGLNEKGSNQNHLMIYGKTDCLKCNNIVIKKIISGRGTFICENCQK